MFGFEAMPPEINSGLMYSGPGAGPMMAASAAWDALADELYLAASAYSSAIADLGSSWLGPSSQSMAASGATFVSWISSTAAQAGEAAAQAKAAVAAYEAAFAMTVPPAVIAANRALLLALVATNFFGQNTAAIMATEADYLEMWAQDAAAMYGYAGASSAASTMAPFPAPQATTNASAASGLAAAATQAAGTPVGAASQAVSLLSSVLSPSALQGALQSIASSATTSSSSTGTLSSFTASTSTSSSTAAVSAGTSVVSGASSAASMLTSGVSMLASSGSLTKVLGSVPSSVGGFPMFASSLKIGAGGGAWASPASAVSAVTGRAASLGALSIPQGWTSAAPAFSQVASALPAGSALPATPSAVTASSANSTSPVGPRPTQTTELGTARTPLATRYNVRPAVVRRPVYAG